MKAQFSMYLNKSPIEPLLKGENVFHKIFIILYVGLFCCDNGSGLGSLASVNSKTSACGGFKALSKSAAYIQDSSDYCSSEKLRWQYDQSTRVLSFFHSRNLQNCAAQITMNAYISGKAIKIEEPNSSKEEADCLCYLDCYCEVKNIELSEIDVEIETNSYSIDISKSSGYVVIDTTAPRKCP